MRWSSWRLWLPVIAYAGLIFVLSHQPKLPSTPGGDKTAHIVAYAGLGFLLARALAPGRSRGARTVLAVLGGALYGCSDEWHQSFVPGRHASVDDLIADGVGAVVGAFAYSLWVASAMQLSGGRCQPFEPVPKSVTDAATKSPKETP